MAHEAVQELQQIDEDEHDEHINQFIDNMFKDLDKTWKMEMISDESDESSQPAEPERYVPAVLLGLHLLTLSVHHLCLHLARPVVQITTSKGTFMLRETSTVT